MRNPGSYFSCAMNQLSRERQQELIQRARREHICCAGATPEAIAATETRLGYALPPALRDLLLAFDGAEFFRNSAFPCRLLPAAEIVPARVAHDLDHGPDSIVVIVAFSGDYVGIDLDPAHSSYGVVLDCFHETFPYEIGGVCNSAWHMLELLLDSGGDDWIWPAVVAYRRDFSEGNGESH